MTGDTLTPTDRTRLRRAHTRGAFDRTTVNAILDAQPLCHVGYVIDGQTAATPTFQWREGNNVYWHGSSASRALKASESTQVCLTVTVLDGLVLARSGFHHSANYRSVMIYGTAMKVEGDAAKTERLKRFVDGLYPGRWDTLRPMNDQELKATTILTMPIEEASAKIRSGPPIDDEEDYALPIWAGVLPVRQVTGTPEPDPRNLAEAVQPDGLGDLELG